MTVEVTLTNVSSGYNLNDINNNFQAIKTALEDAVSKSNSVGNSLAIDLDMDGNNILNIGTLDGDKLVINGKQIVVSELEVVNLTSGGTWADATGYIKDVIVDNNGSSYIAKSAHTSNTDTEPGVGASWTTVWQLLASKGDTGDTGPQGASGTGSGDLVSTQNLSDVADATTALANLGGVSQADFDVLDGAALIDSDVGTTAGKLVQLDGSAKLPAVDGSQLTNIQGVIKNRWFVNGTLNNSTSSSSRVLCSLSNVQAATGDILVFPDFSNTGNGTYTSYNTQGNSVAPAYGYLQFYVDGVYKYNMKTLVKVSNNDVDTSYGDLGLGNLFMYQIPDSDPHTYEIRLETHLASGRMAVGAGISGFIELFTPTV